MCLPTSLMTMEWENHNVFCMDKCSAMIICAQSNFGNTSADNSRDSLEQLKQNRARFEGQVLYQSWEFYQWQILVAYNIAKNLQPHSIGENLIKPRAPEK